MEADRSVLVLCGIEKYSEGEEMIGEHVLYKSNSDEWSTPQELFDVLDAEFHFTLDPCASADNAKCEKYFTASDDGLKMDWGGSQCSAIRPIPGSQSGSRSAIGKV